MAACPSETFVPFCHTTWRLKKIAVLASYCYSDKERSHVLCVPVHLSEFLHIKNRNVLHAWWYNCLEKRDYNPRSLLHYSGRVFLILTPFSLIKSVTQFRSNGSSALKSSQHICGGSGVETVQSGHTK